MKKYIQRNLAPTSIAVSGTNTYTSLWQTVDSFNTYGIQINWSGTPAAVVNILTSMDPIPDLFTFEPMSSAAPQHYDVSTGSSISTSGINVITYDNVSTAANWIAVQWVNSSGTGTITSINLVAKGAQV